MDRHSYNQALNFTEVILKTNPQAITGHDSGQHAATNLADFIEVLTQRLTEINAKVDEPTY